MSEERWRADAEARLASLAKPPGALGTLEDWCVTLCVAQKTLRPYDFYPGNQISARTALRCVGGLEIAAMVGAYIAAAEHTDAVVVVDGFISGVAA